ncbi:MAG: DNA-processing protein DprA [Candidatus Neomarinimicrobiota bacterium]
MNMLISPDTQAILLLTAPLIVGRGGSSADLLTPGEYKKLARFLRDKQHQPADLLLPDMRELLIERQTFIDSNRLDCLLARGFQLSQAVERWQSRAIWVISRADDKYPKRLKTRLNDDAPPILYGCGEAAIADTGGLAVVGSRHVDDVLIEYAESIGHLSAKAGHTLVSGGARGIDQAAMRGALETGGRVTGILADSLERVVLNRENRNLLMDGYLVLISPYDPLAGFNAGQAMQRNKLIYALADAALVVSSDYMKGGTWAGAVEQLDKLRLVPVYVRSNGVTDKGLEALRHKGALPWPGPETPEELAEVLSSELNLKKPATFQGELIFSIREEPKSYDIAQDLSPLNESSSPVSVELPVEPANDLFARLREYIGKVETPRTVAEVAADLQVSKNQAEEWLRQLVNEGLIEKYSKPVKYGPKLQCSFFK